MLDDEDGPEYEDDRKCAACAAARGRRRPLREVGIQECDIDGGRHEGDGKA